VFRGREELRQVDQRRDAFDAFLPEKGPPRLLRETERAFPGFVVDEQQVVDLA
jgi:hypothetical protein